MIPLYRLSNTALFTSLKRLKPKPLEHFGLQRESHAFRQSFLLSSKPPHQNFLTIESILSHMLIGKRVVCIIYKVRAKATVLTKTTLPALERCFFFQPSNFEDNLSITAWKATFFIWNCKRGCQDRFHDENILPCSGLKLPLPSSPHLCWHWNECWISPNWCSVPSTNSMCWGSNTLPSLPPCWLGSK